MNFKKLKKIEEKEADKLHKARVERCVPVAKEIVKLIGDSASEYPFGDSAQDSAFSDELSKKVLTLMLERDIDWVDRQFVLQLALQPISFVKDTVETALNNSWNVVLSGLFGKKVNELKLSEVDEQLRKGHIVEETPEEPGLQQEAPVTGDNSL